MNTVLFACVHNAGRSQMAAAFFNALSDPGVARAISAGTQPGERVHPEVIAAMRDVGIDLSMARPQMLTDALAREAHLLVTMGCGDACPMAPGLRRDDWPLADPLFARCTTAVAATATGSGKNTANTGKSNEPKPKPEKSVNSAAPSDASATSA